MHRMGPTKTKLHLMRLSLLKSHKHTKLHIIRLSLIKLYIIQENLGLGPYTNPPR